MKEIKQDIAQEISATRSPEIINLVKNSTIKQGGSNNKISIITIK